VIFGAVAVTTSGAAPAVTFEEVTSGGAAEAAAGVLSVPGWVEAAAVL
jgi:hypothetical protein